MQAYLKVFGVYFLVLIGSFNNIESFPNDIESDYGSDQSRNREESPSSEHGGDYHIDIGKESEDSENFIETKRIYYKRSPAAQHMRSYTHILHRGSVICAGALVTNDVVITASHCLRSDHLAYEIKAKELFVRTSDTIGSIASQDSLHRVKEVMYPSGKESKHSIVLLILKQSITNKNIKPVALCSASPKDGDAVQLVFLNTLDFKIEHFNSKILPLDTCRKIYEVGDMTDVPLNDNTFCVANKKKSLANTCDTRIGDPLLVGSKLCGINLYGEQCLEHEGPENADVYADVFKMRDFVNKKSTRTITVVS